MVNLADPLTLEDIASARRRIAGVALRTPLVRTESGIWLKLECLQPHGSYKIRGAANAIAANVERGEKLAWIVSASAGNFGQAVAAMARKLGIGAIIHVPDNAARNKVEAIQRLGADVRRHPFPDWWRIMETRAAGDAGTFIHPVCDREVIAGSSSIGEEILEDLPDVQRIYVPIGGGGLAAGIAQAAKMRNPGCCITAVETEAATPLLAALQAGEPVTVERKPSFIDGMGSSGVLREMWPLLKRLIDEVVVVSLCDVEEAIRYLARNHHVVAEGAGAAAVAAALKGSSAPSAAIVSGGNLDSSELRRILIESPR